MSEETNTTASQLPPASGSAAVDFVFVDPNNHRPYRVRTAGSETWLYYWNHGGWVSSRPLKGEEVGAYRTRAIPQDLAEKHYRGGVPFHPQNTD
jgi:hypothetical protein